MRNVTTLALIAATLAGCASTGDLMSRPPNLYVTSAKSSREFAACVQRMWSDSPVNVNTGILSNGYTVTITNPYTGVVALATVVDTPKGSSAEFRAAPTTVSSAWQDRFAACT